MPVMDRTRTHRARRLSIAREQERRVKHAPAVEPDTDWPLPPCTEYANTRTGWVWQAKERESA